MATLRSIAPIFPTADLGAMQAHYEALGFEVHVHEGGYGTAARDGVRHPLPAHARTSVRRTSGARPTSPWTTRTRCTPSGGRRGWARRRDLFDPGFGVWEAAHTDGDGNLLRFGSRLRRP